MNKYYIEVIERLQKIVFNQVNEIEELKKENEELQELADNYNLYHINVKLQGFRPTIDYMSKFFSANNYSNKYYRKR